MRTLPAMALGLLFLSAGAVDAAPPAHKAWSTGGWKASLPADWKLVTHKKGDAAHLGRWRFESPKGNFKVSIRIAPDQGEEPAALAERNLARLSARLSDQKQHKKLVNAEGYVLLVEGKMVRRSNKHLYLTYRSLTRDLPNKLIYTMTLSATGEKLDGFTKLLDQISESFEPVAPVAPAAQEK